jgi:hypothetical protein
LISVAMGAGAASDWRVRWFHRPRHTVARGAFHPDRRGWLAPGPIRLAPGLCDRGRLGIARIRVRGGGPRGDRVIYQRRELAVTGSHGPDWHDPRSSGGLRPPRAGRGGSFVPARPISEVSSRLGSLTAASAPSKEFARVGDEAPGMDEDHDGDRRNNGFHHAQQERA